MYISTKFNIGQVVYLYSADSHAATRCKVSAVRITRNANGDAVTYGVQFCGSGGYAEAAEAVLYDSADSAFFRNPLPVVAEAADEVTA